MDLRKYFQWNLVFYQPSGVGQAVRRLVSECLYLARLGVLPSSSPATCTLKRILGPVLYPFVGQPDTNNN